MTSSPRQEPAALLPEDPLAALDRRQRIAACILVMPGIGADGLPDAATAAAVRAGVGALHSIVGMPASAAARYHAEVRRIAAEAGVPAPLIAGNLEAGIGYSLGRTGTDLPYPRGVGVAADPELAYRTALLAGREARAVGFEWTLSPTIDVLTTDQDPILGVRAFGVDAATTAELGAAQVRGFRDGGVVSTAKHFPGHGDSAVDSHLGLPVIDRDLETHEQVHLRPFVAAIAAGVQTIMVAHVVLPALGVDEPASLSATVNRVWLREQLGFEGVIITDSLRMAAVSARWSSAESTVLALASGADVANVKCEASELPQLIEAVAAAVDDGRVDPAELDRSVLRLFRLRAEIASFGAQLPAPDELDTALRWDDPDRAATVDVAGPLSALDGLTVVGDSEFAGRLTAAAAARGLDVGHVAEPATAATLERLADAAAGTLLPVIVPSIALSDEDRAQIAEVVAASVSPQVAAVVVNGVMAAASLAADDAAVIVAPAVDAFGICTEATVDAVLDRLLSAGGGTSR
ncbi:glycoside hydrolase family 3 protein [Jiangella gansuensis]|uniref:glycoside hydrolase family 3 protein n=1 Tax=Jiangella gansuensis TaxID=281473 RepID=UPI0004B00C41|nr:glycoside hydrolase family 3 N-terminal domain-containing protein [Jiangella gansuensis]